MIWICEPPVSSYFQLQQSCMCFVVFFLLRRFLLCVCVAPPTLKPLSYLLSLILCWEFVHLICTLGVSVSLFLSAGFSAHKSSPLLSPPASSLPLFSVHTRSDPEALECCWLVAATPKQTLVPQPAVWATIRYCSNRSQCVCVCAWLHAFIAFN